MGSFPKIVGVFHPNHPFWQGFSIIFTIHFGVPLFLETPIYRPRNSGEGDLFGMVSLRVYVTLFNG